jgi:hypothetical protein
VLRSFGGGGAEPAAERRLASELAARARALAAAPDAEFVLSFEGGMPPRISWQGERVAALRRGKDALNPLGVWLPGIRCPEVEHFPVIGCSNRAIDLKQL